MDEEEKQYGRKRIKRARPELDNLKEPNPGTSTDKKEENLTGSSEQKEKGAEVEKTSETRTSGRDSSGARGSGRRGRPAESRSSQRDSRKPRERYDRKREKTDSRDTSSQTRPKSTSRARVNVSVIIPAYNEEENIRPLIEMFEGVISRDGKDWEVLIVNDGSTDRTLERCKEAATKRGWLKIVTYPNNRGLTAALNAGFKAARGSILVFYPADLQYHAQDIPRMLAKINAGADLVAGWKQGKYSKRFVSYVYNRLCRWLFNLKIHDMNSVKAFKREVARTLSTRRDWHRYLVVMAAEKEYVIDEVKVKLYPRHRGRSKFGSGRILGGIMDLFSVKFQVTFMKKPLRFFGTWGVIFGGAGVVIGAIALYLRYFTTHGSRTLLFPTMLLVLAGLLLFAIGFLAEVLVGLKEEIESLKSK